MTAGPRRSVFPSSVILLLTALILSAAPATAAEPPTVDVRVQRGPGGGLVTELLQVEPRMGRDIEFFVRIQNLSGDDVGGVEVMLEQYDSQGRLRAFHSFTQPADLDPGEELYVSRRVSTFQPREGDAFMIAARAHSGPHPLDPPQGRALPKNSISLKVPISSCTTFCDRCADRASNLCSQGVESYSCSCTQETASCSFKCATATP